MKGTTDQAPEKEHLAARRILAVTEEELRRVILDIHDGAAQQLFAALAQVKLMQTRLARGESISPVEWKAHLGRQETLLSCAQSEIRDFMSAFRPPDFPRRELVEIIRGLIIQHEGATGCHVDFTSCDPPLAASLPAKIALYRICQEALANAYRHAGTDHQTVRLGKEKGMIVLEVQDEGRGFAPPPLHGPEATEREEHIGLRGMRERVALVKGELELHSEPGQGTRIIVRVPLDE